MDAPIVIETGQTPVNAAVIWLHGLGADGHDFEPLVPELRLPPELSVRFIFPHAPMVPVTINGGYVMRAWYDILAMDIGSEQDAAGIHASQVLLDGMIDEQLQQGIPSERIILAGFSQGGAIALQTALRSEHGLGGVMALSTYLPLAPTLEAEKSDANQAIPIFMAHGDSDPVVRPELAYLSRSRLEQQGYSVNWQEYRGMQHSLCYDEIRDISAWLQARLQ